MTKNKNIKVFRNITNAGVDVSPRSFYKRINLFPNSTAICTVFVLSAVNFQTVCNDLYLGSVQTKNCFYRRHNKADVRTSQHVEPLFTTNCNFGGLYGCEKIYL